MTDAGRDERRGPHAFWGVALPVATSPQPLPRARCTICLHGGPKMTTDTVDIVRLEKPLPSEIDVFGVTHQGHVRPTNADHFLVAGFHRAMKVHATSLGGEILHLSRYSRGYIFLVADGVGSLTRG